tara:strand:+ start:540 stop:1025 length:486 start_codon:yes stop_codon:yes gene_type:complete
MNNFIEKKGVLKVKNFLSQIDSSINLIELTTTAKTAQDAAKSLNQEVGSIVKSLVFLKNSFEYYLCLVSGDKYLSKDKLSLITQNKILKATAEDVKKLTGFSIGGVSPVAHENSPYKVFIDINLKRYKNIFAAAGHPFVIFETNFNQLCNITKGKVTDITE